VACPRSRPGPGCCTSDKKETHHIGEAGTQAGAGVRAHVQIQTAGAGGQMVDTSSIPGLGPDPAGPALLLRRCAGSKELRRPRASKAPQRTWTASPMRLCLIALSTIERRDVPSTSVSRHDRSLCVMGCFRTRAAPRVGDMACSVLCVLHDQRLGSIIMYKHKDLDREGLFRQIHNNQTRQNIHTYSLRLKNIIAIFGSQHTNQQ
jgi:hypothetical protein